MLGCLLNASACSQLALELAKASRTPIGIICSGWYGAFALDDAIAAGALVGEICKLANGAQPKLTDAAHAARRLWETCQDPAAALRTSSSGQLLVRLGLSEDIEACARVNTSQTVPILQDGPPPQFVAAKPNRALTAARRR